MLCYASFCRQRESLLIRWLPWRHSHYSSPLWWQRLTAAAQRASVVWQLADHVVRVVLGKDAQNVAVEGGGCESCCSSTPPTTVSGHASTTMATWPLTYDFYQVVLLFYNFCNNWTIFLSIILLRHPPSILPSHYVTDVFKSRVLMFWENFTFRELRNMRQGSPAMPVTCCDSP